MKKIDIQTLKEYKEKGWLHTQVHPTLPLTIVNYTNTAVYDQVWDEITLNCRGTVIDKDGNIVSKGFPKFFNYSEGRTNIPENIEYVEVWEKMDGSYIGLFYYDGQWVVNSKGSFNSDHVGWAWEILEGFDLGLLDKSLTYCFELIFPQNRIVCNYFGMKALYFLAAFEDGEEVGYLYPKELRGTIINFPKLVQLNTFNPEKLQVENRENEEGYVIKFQNGERCKIKFEEYVKLHSLYTKTSTVDIWECMKDGGNIYKIIEDAPDEIFDFIKGVVSEITENFHSLKSSIEFEYETISSILGDCTDKEFALAIKDNKNSSFLFALRNRKDIDKQIWKKIKPERKTYSKF